MVVTEGGTDRAAADLAEAVRGSGLLAPGERVVVAVSGGPDSTALLHVLVKLAGPLQLRLTAAHFDHGLRGDASRRDAESVASLCHRWGVTLCTGRAGPLGGPSVEASAREARYAFLKRVAIAQGAQKVATAHHRDDQAETVLLRLLRGSGAQGLAGMRPARPLAPGVWLIRPFLGIPGEALRRYCADFALPVRQDETNADEGILRNRIRSRLLPLLEREYQPGCTEALARTARLLADDDAYLLSEAAIQFERLRQGAALQARELAQLPPAIGRRVVRLWWHEGCGRREALSFDHIEALRLGRETDLPGGAHASSAGGWLRLVPAASSPTFQYMLPVPGHVDVVEAGMRITARLWQRDAMPQASPWLAAGDAAAVVLPLTVRNRRPGDRFRPLGGPGTRKLQDVLVDARIPREVRDRVPLVTDGEGRILWVVGVRQADFWRLHKEVQQVLVLAAESLGE